MTFLLALMYITGLFCDQPSSFQVSAKNPLSQDTLPSWMIGPFTKVDSVNPCLLPSSLNEFFCPVRNQSVRWEAKDVFNPTIIGRNERLLMLYRAEDSIGKFAGTSRLGLAYSKDGLHFEKSSTPVFYPDRDQMHQYEWEGGCEDPRIVRRSDGVYILTYTAYDGNLARLCIASSRDLRSWTKHGLAFAKDGSGNYADEWSKSGAIVSKYDTNGVMTARMINGKYWMYWGDKHMHLATSPDCIAWSPLTGSDGSLKNILSPRPGKFDSDLVEPGPAAMTTKDGILLIYNSRNYGESRDTSIAEGTYSAAQVLFDGKDPSRVLKRADTPFLIPDKPYEVEGQVNRVVFVEGLVRWKGRWMLYYGTADSKIGVAVGLTP